jgi:hypothetical protein
MYFLQMEHTLMSTQNFFLKNCLSQGRSRTVFWEPTSEYRVESKWESLRLFPARDIQWHKVWAHRQVRVLTRSPLWALSCYKVLCLSVKFSTNFQTFQWFSAIKWQWKLPQKDSKPVHEGERSKCHLTIGSVEAEVCRVETAGKNHTSP